LIRYCHFGLLSAPFQVNINIWIIINLGAKRREGGYVGARVEKRFIHQKIEFILWLLAFVSISLCATRGRRESETFGKRLLALIQDFFPPFQVDVFVEDFVAAVLPGRWDFASVSSSRKSD
jgi:hypothetical protein